MPRAVVNIDQAAQTGRAGGINRKAIIPKPQDRDGVTANMQAIAAVAPSFPAARLIQTMADMFGQVLKHGGLRFVHHELAHQKKKKE